MFNEKQQQQTFQDTTFYSRDLILTLSHRQLVSVVAAPPDELLRCLKDRFPNFLSLFVDTFFFF